MYKELITINYEGDDFRFFCCSFSSKNNNNNNDEEQTACQVRGLFLTLSLPALLYAFFDVLSVLNDNF